MVFENYTPFPAIAWENIDAFGQWHITTVARVKYTLVSTEKEYRLQLSPDQGELFGEDIFYGKIGQSSVRFESDFITYKPTTDIIVNAKAYFPAYCTKTQCKIEVYRASGHLLREVSLRLLSLYGKSNKPKEVALCYENSYGGGYAVPTKGDPHNYHILDEYNSIGIGKYDRSTPQEKRGKPLMEFVENKYRQKPYPAGFGIIYRAWKSRLQYAGTYNEDWLNNQHPLSPYDFDHKFNQAANPALQLSEYLDIHSSIILTNLTGSNERVVLRIPDVIVFCEQHTQQQTRILHNMHIDTVIIDIDSDDKEQWAVYVSYRSFVKKRQDYESVSCHFLTNELLKEEV